MSHTHLVAAIVPDALLADAELLTWALGFQPAPASSPPHDHTWTTPAGGGWAMVTWAGPGLLAFLGGLVVPPVAWADYGLTEARALAVRDALAWVSAPIADSPNGATLLAGLTAPA